MKYTVTVSNIGTVHQSRSLRLARAVFRNYVELSKAPFGRAAGETVTLFANAEMTDLFVGSLTL